MLFRQHKTKTICWTWSNFSLLWRVILFARNMLISLDSFAHVSLLSLACSHHRIFSTCSNLFFTKSSLIHSVQHPFKLSSAWHTNASSAVSVQTFPIISGRREREKVYRKYNITSFEYGIIDFKKEKEEKKLERERTFFFSTLKKFNTRYISFPSSGFRLYHPRTATRLKGRRESVWKMNWKWKASFLACSVLWRWEISDTTENRLRNTDKKICIAHRQSFFVGSFSAELVHAVLKVSNFNSPTQHRIFVMRTTNGMRMFWFSRKACCEHTNGKDRRAEE